MKVSIMSGGVMRLGVVLDIRTKQGAKQMSKSKLQEVLAKEYGLKVTLGAGFSADEMTEMVELLQGSAAAAKIFSHINAERNQRAALNGRLNKDAFSARQQRNSLQNRYEHVLKELSFVRQQLDIFVNGYEQALDHFLTLDNSQIYRAVRHVKATVFPPKPNQIKV